MRAQHFNFGIMIHPMGGCIGVRDSKPTMTRINISVRVYGFIGKGIFIPSN